MRTRSRMGANRSSSLSLRPMAARLARGVPRRVETEVVDCNIVVVLLLGGDASAGVYHTLPPSHSCCPQRIAPPIWAKLRYLDDSSRRREMGNEAVVKVQVVRQAMHQDDRCSGCPAPPGRRRTAPPRQGSSGRRSG